LIRKQWTDLYLSGDEFKEYLVAEQQRIEKVMDALGLVK
jgi:tripartite-type tricarboxylate transporter receptor subunit TctC